MVIRLQQACERTTSGKQTMAKTNRKLNKANHGQRPASSKARKQKRKHVKLS
jgi:hypothetical protein